MRTSDKQKRWASLFIAVAAGLIVGAFVRYQVFDTNTLNWLCEGGKGPLWCDIRRGAKTVLQWQALSLIALASAVSAYVTGQLRPILLSAGLGAAGIFLYGPELSGAALLIAALRLVRPLSSSGRRVL